MGKGVLGPIKAVDKSMLPIDPITGRRAQIAFSAESTNNRIDYGRWWEHGINAARFAVEDMFKSITGLDKDSPSLKTRLGQVSQDKLKQCFDLKESFLSCGFVKQYHDYISMSYQDKVMDLYYDLKEKIYLYLPPDNPVPALVIVKNLKEKGLLPEPRKMLYYDEKAGKLMPTQYETIIGSLYYIVLEKIGANWAAVSVANTNPNGIIPTITSREKSSSQTRDQSTRLPEEASVRSYVASTRTGTTVNLHDRSNNPKALANGIERIYGTTKPTDMDVFIDRDKFPLGYSIPRVNMRHVMQCEGIAFKHTPFNPDLQAQAQIDPITGTIAAMKIEEDPENKKGKKSVKQVRGSDDDDEETSNDSFDILLQSEIEQEDD